VLARAFRDNPMNIEIHGPNPKRRIRANRAGLCALVLDSHRKEIVRVIKHENQVVGGFVVAPPSQRVLTRPSLSRQIGCFWHQGARAMVRWGQVSRGLSRFRPHVPHWYLAVLGVDPEHQGRGLGGRLLEALFELAREGPTPVYLESDRPESVRFYRGRGFESRAERGVHGVTCWCLGQGFPDERADLCDSVRLGRPLELESPTE
jgi:ribosomal protein S18 acetylase RimI-like enzyme